MSLYSLHKLLIAVAIVFCAGFALRTTMLVVTPSGHGGRLGTALLALASVALGAALTVYLRWVVRTKSALGGRPRRGA